MKRQARSRYGDIRELKRIRTNVYTIEGFSEFIRTDGESFLDFEGGPALFIGDTLSRFKLPHKEIIGFNFKNKDVYKIITKTLEYRRCTQCKKIMFEGYIIRDGDEYYCSDKCLNKHYTEKEIEDLELGENDSYWTDWN